MAIVKEFKKFAIKGNMMDMAIGIIIGGAFGTIVKSLVDDIIMPPVGLLLGGIDFSQMAWTLRSATETAKAVTLNYGLFINAIVAFLIVAWALFFVMKGMNSLKSEEPETEPTEKKCTECLMKVPIKAKKCGHCTSTLV